jgi:hypothetical protein
MAFALNALYPGGGSCPQVRAQRQERPMALDDLGCRGSCGVPSCFALLHDAHFTCVARTARASGGQPTASALGQRRCRLGSRHAGATLPTGVATSVGPRRPWCGSTRDGPRGCGRSFGRLQPGERTGRCHGGSYGRHCCINLASSQIKGFQVDPGSTIVRSAGSAVRYRSGRATVWPSAECDLQPEMPCGGWARSIVSVGRIAFE